MEPAPDGSAALDEQENNMSFATWIENRRWSANMRRARNFRNSLPYSARLRFDRALRPERTLSASRYVIDYPDAFYHVSIDDLCRAMKAAREHGGAS